MSSLPADWLLLELELCCWLCGDAEGHGRNHLLLLLLLLLLVRQ